MEPSPACPACGAPAQARQRWCLECGGELPAGRRAGLRPAVGIATALALLVGAASAGGYTLLHKEAQPPPAATTVAASPPAPATLPPATSEPPVSPYSAPAYTPPVTGAATPGRLPRSSTRYRPGARAHGGNGGASSAAERTTSGSAIETTTQPQAPPARKPQYALTNVALGAAAVAYAPYASANADLGDASRVVDGTTRTAWRTLPFSDPAARPQEGVYVDLASAQKLRKLVLTTPTPGISIEVYGATHGPPSAITGKGWEHLATRDDVAAKTTIGLPSRPLRYVLVWIVGLPPGSPTAAISELAVLSLQPA
jgi:hypothetical protein